MSRSHMILATCCALSVGRQQTGFELITSLIFMGDLQGHCTEPIWSEPFLLTRGTEPHLCCSVPTVISEVPTQQISRSFLWERSVSLLRSRCQFHHGVEGVVVQASTLQQNLPPFLQASGFPRWHFPSGSQGDRASF